MNSRTLITLLTLTAALACGAARAESYGLRPGDVLEVSVWKEADLIREVLVRPDGGISFPLAGDLNAAGLSVEQVKAEIAQRLEKFIPDPEVSVAVKQLNGNVVYVIGKVNKPGIFPVFGTVDVMQALSMAGGTATFAKVNDIQVLRRQGETQQAIPFRYADVESGRNLDQNIILAPGDVVVVP